MIYLPRFSVFGNSNLVQRLKTAMAFSGVSRTLTDTVGGGGSSSGSGHTSAFEFSTEEWTKTRKEVDEFYNDIMMKNLPTKNCYSIEMKNNVPIQPILLQSKEKRALWKKVGDKVQGHVYCNHTIIYLTYIPSILESSQGLMSLKLFNSNTGESLDIDTDAPANEAAIYVTRWPRSLLRDQKEGLSFLPSVNCPEIRQEAIVGKMFPIWDDSLEKKMLYEKEYPTLRFPIAKTEAVSVSTNSVLLKALVRQRMISGSGDVDLNPELIDIKRAKGKKAKTVDFKRIDAPSSPKIEDVTDQEDASVGITTVGEATPSDELMKEGVTSTSKRFSA